MKDEIFFDTNILTYVHDESEPAKREICGALMQSAFKGEIAGVVSNQILAEFYASLTERLRKPVPKLLAMSLVESLIVSGKWTKVSYDAKTVQNALDILEANGGTIFDAIVVSTMKENGITKIYTEDKFFFKVPGIKAINPFKK